MERWLLMVVIACSCSSREERAPRTGEPPAAEGAVDPPPTPAEPAAVPAADAALPPAAAAAEPPSFPGARLVTSAEVRSFAVGPESLYWCDSDVLRAAPRAGGDVRQLGTCAGASDVLPDGDSMYFCSDRGLVRVANGSETMLATTSCLVPMVDDTHVYYLVPGFEGVPDPGVYRVAKAGGPPEKLYSRTPREQYNVALDGDTLWIGTFGAGVISKLAKAGGKIDKVVGGQKRMADLAVDDQWLYWLIEGPRGDAGEVRRRKKRGGPIEVIGRAVSQEPLVVVQGHAYWFEGGEGQGTRLMHLAPGAAEAEPIVDGLAAPWFEVGGDEVYLIQYGKPGIFALPRRE